MITTPIVVTVEVFSHNVGLKFMLSVRHVSVYEMEHKRLLVAATG